MSHLWRRRRAKSAGDTLVEALISMSIGSVVIAGSLSLFTFFLRSYNMTTLVSNSAWRADFALERMVFGVGTNIGLRAASASTVTVSQTSTNWTITYNTNMVFRYTASTGKITDQSNKVICSNLVASSVNFWTNGCDLSVTVVERGGGKTATNTMSSSVTFRN